MEGESRSLSRRSGKDSTGLSSAEWGLPVGKGKHPKVEWGGLGKGHCLCLPCKSASPVSLLLSEISTV